MNIEQKSQLVEKLKADFLQSKIILVAHYSGLTVAQMNELRSQSRKEEVKIQVAKNSLIKLAIEGTEYANLEDKLCGPTILIFSDDIVAAAKILVSFAKENELLKIQTGSYNNSIVGKEEIVQISKMPSLDEIRAKLISLIKTPATQVACVLNAPALDCVRVVKAYSEK